MSPGDSLKSLKLLLRSTSFLILLDKYIGEDSPDFAKKLGTFIPSLPGTYASVLRFPSAGKVDRVC